MYCTRVCAGTVKRKAECRGEEGKGGSGGGRKEGKKGFCLTLSVYLLLLLLLLLAGFDVVTIYFDSCALSVLSTSPLSLLQPFFGVLVGLV